VITRQGARSLSRTTTPAGRLDRIDSEEAVDLIQRVAALRSSSVAGCRATRAIDEQRV
jgi:hypothetical protein